MKSLLFGVFATHEDGISTVKLPEKGDWYEWFSGKIYANTDEAEIALSPQKAAVFIHYPLWKEIQKNKIL